MPHRTADLHSKWPELVCLSSATSTTIIRSLKALFSRWGIPRMITTDGGPQFVSNEFEDFLKAYGITHRRTPFYHPQGNSGVERLNRVGKEGLKSHLQDGYSFLEAVQSILWAYRSTPHALTGVTPAELMLGRKITTPLWTLKPGQATKEHPVAGQIAAKQQRQFDRLNRTRKPPRQFRVGDMVRVRSPRMRGKLQSHMSPPLRVSDIISPTIVVLEDGSRWHTSVCLPLAENNGARVTLPVAEPAPLPQPQAADGPVTSASPEAIPASVDDAVPRRGTRLRGPPMWYG